MERSIRLDNVSKKVKGVWVLKDISLEFREGTVYGLCGCNGSGKTMMLRMIAGLIHPTEGKVYINNRILHKDMDYPDSIGVLIESPKFWKHYTGYEVLKTLADIKKVIGDDEIKNAMRRVCLNPDDTRTLKKYSLGMKQKLGIAQAIMENPEILLLDEPTNALDLDSIEQTRKIIREERDKGSIVIIASHNVSDLDICDEQIEMNEGRAKICKEK